MKHLRFLYPPPPPKKVAQKFHFAILRIKVTRASRGLSAIADLLVIYRCCIVRLQPVVVWSLQSCYSQLILTLLYDSLNQSVELNSGTMRVLHCSAWTVLRTWCSGALSCCKTKLSSAICLVASDICWDSKIFRQYSTVHHSLRRVNAEAGRGLQWGLWNRRISSRTWKSDEWRKWWVNRKGETPPVECSFISISSQISTGK